MSMPSDDPFVFTPARPEGAEGEAPTITVPSLAKLPRTYAMVEASAAGNDAKFIVNGIRNLGDKELEDAIRDLPASEWERFMNEWRAYSRTSVGE